MFSFQRIPSALSTALLLTAVAGSACLAQSAGVQSSVLRPRRQTLVAPESKPTTRPLHGVRYKVGTLGKAQVHAAATPQCSNPKLAYFEGPVISNVKSVVVYWNSDVNAALTVPIGGITQFLGDLSNSNFMSVLSQYSTYGDAISSGTTQWIGNGSSTVPSFIISPVKCQTGSTNCTVSDDDIQTELQRQISLNVLPAQTYDDNGKSNTLYMTYFPPGVHVTGPDGAGNSCAVDGFCAYHNTGGTIAAPLTYGVLMDTFTSACATGCGDSSTPMENQTSVTSHEFAEAVTDTEIGLDTDSSYAYPAGWGDNSNSCGEIADICDDGTQDTITVSGRNWKVQELWSNSDNQCESSGTVSRPFAFSGSSTATAGTPVSFTLTAQNPTGGTFTKYAGTVHFTSSDSGATLPADYTFVVGDAGAHTFSATFANTSTQTITATDTVNGALTSQTSFTVSSAQVAVPNVVGDTKSAAESAITGAGLTVGTETTQSSNTVASGLVISQNPTTSTQVNTGTAVNLVISSGPLKYLLTINRSPSGGGSVSPASGGHYTPNTVVSLKATPAAGFLFSGWSGPVSSTTSNPTTVIMKAAESVTANFVSALKVSPASLNFGTVYLGSVTSKYLTITNEGAENVSVTNMTVSVVKNGDSREFIEENLCSKPLATHQTCQIRISFVAGAFYHQQSATLVLHGSTGATGPSIGLTALTIDPVAQLNASSLNFGTSKVGVTTASKTIMLTNTGATALSVSSLSLGGSTPADFKAANGCTSPVSPGASCTIGVTFKAVSKGAKSAKLQIHDNAKNSPQTVTLTGTGN